MLNRRAGLAAGIAALALWAPAAQAADVAGAAEVLKPTASLQEAVDAAVASGAKPQKLRKPRPAWFTKRLERKVERRGYAAPPADAPLPGEIGIRPGSLIISPYICTTNFIFQKNGVLAIGTAGHCVEGGETVTLLTLAPTGGNPVLVELGRVLFKVDGGIGNDYALIEIPRERYDWVFPTIGGVGGPCGVYADAAPTQVFHYGHGLVVGTGGTPRAGQGIHLEDDPTGLELEWDDDSFAWAGLLAGGDSGSAVRVTTLGALGDLTHGIGLAVPGGDLPPSAIGWGTRVTKVTNKGWTVVNSPLCP